MPEGHKIDSNLISSSLFLNCRILEEMSVGQLRQDYSLCF